MSNQIFGAPPRPRLREVLALVLVVGAGVRVSAQDPTQYAPAPSMATTLDARWAPWLGCWRAEAVVQSNDASNSSVTCVVPLSGTSGVQEVSITRGTIVSRRRYVADGRPNSFDENGCHGTRTVSWSMKSRRVYMRSSYTCNAGLTGSSSGVLSLTATGDWLNVENMRAGQGSIQYVDHWHDAGIPVGIPSEIVNALEANRLAVGTARASAALALGADDIVDALRYVDPLTVQSWIAASGQQFSLTGDEIMTLSRANVPRSVLQAMVGWTPQPGAMAPGYDPNAYLNSVAGMNYAVQQPQPQVIVIQPNQQPIVVSQDNYGQEPMSPTYCTAVACYPTNQYTGYNNYPLDYSPYYPYGIGLNPFFPISPFVTTNFITTSPFFPRVIRRNPIGVFPGRPFVGVPGHPIVRGGGVIRGAMGNGMVVGGVRR